MTRPLPWFRRLAAFAVFILSLAIAPAGAVNPQGANSLPAPRGDIETDERSRAKRIANRSFEQGLRRAHRLIERRQYERGIVALRVLGRDMHPDVATDLGFASHRLGNYDDAKYWYEEALTADPRHARAWCCYGQWHAEQGNVLKALGYLDKVRAIGGTDTPEYRELAATIERAGIS